MNVLYNSFCGDWSFSDEFFSPRFVETFYERYGRDIDIESGSNSVRYDPRVISLYHELGSDLASHINARLKLTTFPQEWKDCMEIRIFEGREVVCFSREKAYKNLLDDIIATKSVTEDVVAKYNEIEDMYKKYGL